MKDKKKIKHFFILFLIIILSFLIIINVNAFAYDLQSNDKILIRFNKPSKPLVNYIFSLNYDIASYKPNIYIDIVTIKSVYDEFVNKGYDVKIIKIQKNVKINIKKSRAAHRGAAISFSSYHTYDEIISIMTQFEADYPSICKLYNIGNTRGKEYYEGQNDNYADYNQSIWALKVSDNVSQEEDEPSTFFMGVHHGREIISAEVPLYTLNYIINKYSTQDETILKYINNNQIWFIPVVNPNGHKIAIDGTDSMWRKNIRDNNDNKYFDKTEDGVDLNRNYGFQWGNVNASDNWNSDVYHGPNAWSEPETLAIKNILEAHHFITGISYHSYGQLVLFPYGYDSNAVAPDYDAMYNLAKTMAITILASGNNYYTPQEAWKMYPTMGDLGDFAYGDLGIFPYTIELATVWDPPANQIETICAKNLNAALILLERPEHSMLTGIITDTTTGKALVAQITVSGVDDTGAYRKPYKSDTTFGRYFRLLNPGYYNISFSASGYDTRALSKVEIKATEKTIKNISLNPQTTPSSGGDDSGGSCFIMTLF